MPALNFQDRFAPLVERKEKRQTIRAYRKDGRDPRPGDILHLFTGMRTKRCRRIGKFLCKETSLVKIDLDRMEIGRYLYVHRSMLNKFAHEDGFNSWEEMMCWFAKAHGLPFTGLMIKW